MDAYNTSEPLPNEDVELQYHAELGDLPLLVQLADNINTYVSPLLLIVGSLGNLMSLLVLSRLSRKVLSTCLYLAAFFRFPFAFFLYNS